MNRHSPSGMPRVERNQGRLFRARIVSRRFFRSETRLRIVAELNWISCEQGAKDIAGTLRGRRAAVLIR
ncbi:MAG: hypothetical protein NXI27_30270 [Alphaproteobacteria bacterium]|nr:hypothetical protein [Alphaproteobacteria bacterium]